MPAVPAICDTCGSVFPSGIVVENSTEVSFKNIAAGPCPNCGGGGHVPDGVYDFIGSTIEFLGGPERSIQELQLLARLLGEAQEKQATPQEIRNTIEQELPELRGWTDLLPQTRQDVYALITIALMVISIVIALRRSGKTEINIHQTVNQIYKENVGNPSRGEGSIDIEFKDVGRNDRCPCGSGRKFKKCHGSPASSN